MSVQTTQHRWRADMRRGMRGALKMLFALLLGSILPQAVTAQEWHKEDCANLAIQFDPDGPLSANGTDCWQLKSAKGRLEMINARAVSSMFVTTLYHVESLDVELRRSEAKDFVAAIGMFTKTSVWSPPMSTNGYQVWKFRGELKIDPFWDARCITFARYDGAVGDRFRHQISGFSCIDPAIAADGMTDAEAADLLGRISQLR
ncbi:MAG: hypothetical protein HYU58_03150 [Proteobacteria bacterium]|nr:hypothetical protein [Pseudomonadota bacterium]